MRIDVTLKPSDELLAALARIEGLYRLIYRSQQTMSGELDNLTSEVQQSTTVMASAATLIEGLAKTIRDNIDNPVKLKALADELDASTNALSAAVAANTPAEPPPPGDGGGAPTG